MIRKFIIYGLSDPRTGELRYVGRSSSGLVRPRKLHDAHCLSWQKHLKNLGLEPIIDVLEEWDGAVDLKSWLRETETFWIAYWRMVGADLTNLTDGGEGLTNPNIEVRRKMSASHIGKHSGMYGKVVPEERRERISFALKGIKKKEMSKETRKKISEAKCGTKLSDEHKMKISLANKGRGAGRTLSEDTREKIRIAHVGLKASIETRMKMSDSRRGKKRGPYRRRIDYGEKIHY